jgi:hypothetical protein
MRNQRLRDGAENRGARVGAQRDSKAADPQDENWKHTEWLKSGMEKMLRTEPKVGVSCDGLLRHAKVTTTLDLYAQAIDASELEAQKDIALAGC